MVHATRHATKEATPVPERSAARPARPALQQWTLYQQLAHAWPLTEHSIQLYKTDVLEEHTGQPDATLLTPWDDLVPERDIGAFTEVIRNTAPNHPFEEHYDPTMLNINLARHSWAI